MILNRITEIQVYSGSGRRKLATTADSSNAGEAPVNFLKV
jgi:hypothetical protein